MDAGARGSLAAASLAAMICFVVVAAMLLTSMFLAFAWGSGVGSKVVFSMTTASCHCWPVAAMLLAWEHLVALALCCTPGHPWLSGTMW